ncbi:MAG TPA: AfsR/SARP family transcriptional regulator, partial [Candidatus Nanopelagicales bacterium]|nr:AfsR/SARP family transcriptional regulator [Candidatus Nanopelagicales bacterium]
MEIWTLGTLEVSHDERAIDLHGHLPRRLLALLSLAPGQEVRSDALVEDLWGLDAPASAASTLQSHVARLRRALPDPAAVRTGRSGYLLDVDPEVVDAVRFDRLVREGHQQLARGDAEGAGQRLRSALELWRGAPYAEFAGCAPLEQEAERLSALRLDALEGRISAELSRPGGVVPVAELEALVRWHPLRESFWTLLLAALYRVGRQADALAAYRRARTLLDEELGVEPGAALQEMHR